MNNILLIITSICLEVFLIIFFIKKKNIFNNLYPSYDPIQKIHLGYIPPLGGLAIFICINFNISLNGSGLLIQNWYIFLPSYLIFIFGLIEDLFGSIKASTRFIVIFLMSTIFVSHSINLPSLEFWIFGEIINNNRFIQVLFFAMGLTAVSNGLNMIDGMNGLAGFTSLMIITSLITLVFLLDQKIINLSNPLILLSFYLIVFMIFNFPFGKIFLGDSGAYWIGWLLGAHVIKYFAEYEINTWAAPIILFYPLMESVFSTIRKLITKNHPFEADVKHLHIKLFRVIHGPNKRNKFYNSFTTLCLMPFWMLPSSFVIWVNYYSHLAFFFLFFLILIYVYYYYLIPVKNYHNKSL